MGKFSMTAQDARVLEEEVRHLKGMLRLRISQTITGARELGDPKENTEYHTAREQQGMVETCICNIEAELSNTQVIDVTAIPHSDKVIFGTIVDIVNAGASRTMTYQTVGDDEADTKGGKISVNSSIVRMLISKTEGDAVLVKTSGGDVEYEIIEARHT